MGIERLFNAPGRALIKTTLVKSQHSYLNKCGQISSGVDRERSKFPALCTCTLLGKYLGTASNCNNKR